MVWAANWESDRIPQFKITRGVNNHKNTVYYGVPALDIIVYCCVRQLGKLLSVANKVISRNIFPVLEPSFMALSCLATTNRQNMRSSPEVEMPRPHKITHPMGTQSAFSFPPVPGNS